MSISVERHALQINCNCTETRPSVRNEYQITEHCIYEERNDLSYGDRRLYIYENFTVGALGSITLSGLMPSNVSGNTELNPSKKVKDKAY